MIVDTAIFFINKGRGRNPIKHYRDVDSPFFLAPCTGIISLILIIGTLTAQVTDETLEGGYASAAFHPDGVLLGSGTQEGVVRVWDVKGQKVSTRT